jgi:hypothetical protein
MDDGVRISSVSGVETRITEPVLGGDLGRDCLGAYGKWSGEIGRGRTWCTVWAPTHRAYRVVEIKI